MICVQYLVTRKSIKTILSRKTLKEGMMFIKPLMVGKVVIWQLMDVRPSGPSKGPPHLE